jgi:hypothetical protein
MAARGLPIGPSVAVFGGHGYPLYFQGRDGAGRTPVLTQTDLYVQHDIKLGTRHVIFSANVLNLFDQRTAIDRFNNVIQSSQINFDEAAFYAGQVNVQSVIDAQLASGLVKADPRFLKDSSFQSPLLARFGVKFTF